MRVCGIGVCICKIHFILMIVLNRLQYQSRCRYHVYSNNVFIKGIKMFNMWFIICKILLTYLFLKDRSEVGGVHVCKKHLKCFSSASWQGSVSRFCASTGSFMRIIQVFIKDCQIVYEQNWLTLKLWSGWEVLQI